jgi:hypothetical protein
MSSEEICEALVRHVETTGSDVFEKNFVKDGKILCTVWCVVGENAQPFNEAVTEWLNDNGFNQDN